MCGIVGIIDTRSAVNSGRLRVAAATLLKRGPDDSGVWISDGVGFGHQRLAILDPTPAGRQPMTSSDGRFVIVFNGEIYNFLDLRQQLEKNGRTWQSRCDTEVILAAYAEWGTECLEKFHGMFAFAIFDRQRRCLFAARDRTGVKPFYYHHCPSCFAFASRPRALLALLPELPRGIDQQALRLYLESGYVPAPYSIYREIHKLPPAHYLLVEDSHLTVRRYWDYRQIATDASWENRTEEDLLDELDGIVSRSVRSRLISDVPLGVFLSGGIDSSLVAGMMAKRASGPVKTFSIGFKEEDYDESGHALAVAQHLDTEHYSERLKIDDLLELMPRYGEEFDEPFFDSSAFPMMAVSRLARRHVTVSLSGDGGDEFFGGYSYYRIVQRLAAFFKLPATMRAAAISLVGSARQHKFQLLAGALRQPDVLAAFAFVRSIDKDFSGVLQPELMRRTLSMGELFSDAAGAFPPNLPPSEQAMRLDAFYTLPDDYLQKVDVATMAFSLEAREPLLDHELVEWSMRLPLKWKIRGSENKYLLRRLAYRYVPRKLLDRPKQGFEVPLDRWLRGSLKGWATERLNSRELFEDIPLNQAKTLELFRLHCSGKRNVHPLLWAILMLLEFGRVTSSHLSELPAREAQPLVPDVRGCISTVQTKQ